MIELGQQLVKAELIMQEQILSMSKVSENATGIGAQKAGNILLLYI